MKKPDTFTKSQLKDRGWTDGAIKKFLGDCDATGINRYTRKKPILLWYQERVLKAEESEEFKAWQEKTGSTRKKQSERMFEIAQQKKQEIIAFVDNLAIEVPSIPYPDLIRNSCHHYNEYKQYIAMERGQYDADLNLANEDSDPYFLYRITCNYIRHQMTSYDYMLSALFGQTGKEIAYERLKKRVMGEINKVYSDLLRFLLERKQEKLKKITTS